MLCVVLHMLFAEASLDAKSLAVSKLPILVGVLIFEDFLLFQERHLNSMRFIVGRERRFGLEGFVWSKNL